MAALTVGELIADVAGAFAPQYDGIVEKQDIEQELWVWVLDGGRTETKKYQAGGDEKLYRFKLRNAALKYGERERKASLGYDWRDDYNYTRPEVARILPLALDPSTIPGLSGGGLHDGPSAKSDPAYGGGMLASIIDIRVAFGKLSATDQEYARLVVDCDSDWDLVAKETGLQANSAYAKYMRILDRMVTRHLGRKADDAN